MKSTVAKGNKFEDEVMSYLKDMLSHGSFPFRYENCRIFRKKKYYSEQRKGEIEIDVSIEIYYPSSNELFLLIPIECKNYKNTIPVDDIEEFYTKVKQITGLNTKAMFFTTSTLQKGALNFAKYNNIAVIRFLPDKQIYEFVARKWIFNDLILQEKKKENEVTVNDDPKEGKTDEIFLSETIKSNDKIHVQCGSKYLVGSEKVGLYLIGSNICKYLFQRKGKSGETRTICNLANSKKEKYLRATRQFNTKETDELCPFFCGRLDLNECGLYKERNL